MRTIFQNAVSGFASIVVTTSLVAASAPSAAAVRTGAPTATVQTADLDLSSAAGQSAAKRRIATATEQVCSAAVDSIAGARCRTAALTDAMTALRAQTDQQTAEAGTAIASR